VKRPIAIGQVGLLSLLLLLSAHLLGQSGSVPGPATSSGGSHSNPRQSDPKLEVARLRNEGVAQFESGIGLKQARAAFEAALALQPQSAVELFNLGATQRKLGDAEQAMQLLSAAAKRDPSLTHAHYTLGLLHRGQGNALAAVSAFEAARKSLPADPSIHYQLGRLYRELRREPEALQSFIDALHGDPQHSGTMYQLYLYYQEHGEADRAKSMFEEFSRVKRALSRTRKEINDDESELARPLRGATAVSGPSSTAVQLQWQSIKPVDAERIMHAVVRDIDADGLDDLLLTTIEGFVLVRRNEGAGRFQEHANFKPEVTGNITGLFAEVLVRDETYRLVLATERGVFVGASDLKSSSPKFTKVSDATGEVSFADLDHDGDVDLIVGGFSEVLINDGAAGMSAGPYLDSTSVQAVRKYSGPIVAVDMLDRNGIDFVLNGADGKRAMLADILGGKHVHAEFEALSSVKRVTHAMAGDLDNDGRVDLISASAQALHLDYHSNRYAFTRTSLQHELGADTMPIIGDFDNDGWKDLLALNGTQARWWRNLGGRKFAASHAGEISPGAPKSVAASDMDRDGRLDLIVLRASGTVEVLRNRTAGLGKSMRVILNGIRSAPSGLHTIVEIRRGNSYQKYVSQGNALDLPLGEGDYAEIVRINWPNGFVENKLKVDGGKLWSFKESERVSGSCPSVFAWDGKQFRFVTDAFISGPMGVPAGANGYFPVDHDEYLKIPGEALRVDDGKLRVAITEELREVVFLDQVRLLAVDHPQDTEMYPNEFLLPGVFPEFKLHLTQAVTTSLRAHDQTGRDVSELVRDVDRRYPANFRRLQYEGLAEENYVALDLPAGAARAASLRMFLTGWFHYFESTSLVAASQRKDLQMQFPSIDVLDQDGWRPVLAIGIPSGKDKTVVVDLTNKLPPDARRVRVRSNVALYWDRIAIDTQPAPSDYRMAVAPLQSARLRFKGFSALEAVDIDQQPQPERFVYDAMRVSAPWSPLVGFYTRYGSVKPILDRVDSQMTVFGSGDELLLEFAADQLEPPPAGWRRDYLLHLDGFVKDGDRYTAHAGTTAPIPFAGMESYPYDTDAARVVFETPEYKAYHERYQTRARLRFTGPRMAPFVDDSTDLPKEPSRVERTSQGEMQ
jgi:Tfp pilus assembly protein PilF